MRTKIGAYYIHVRDMPVRISLTEICDVKFVMVILIISVFVLENILCGMTRDT
jgi:hypothetical protein